MATSLASQLKKLATPQTALLDDKRYRRSILFGPSEAAKYGRDIYFDIGRSGFDDLAEMNNAFLQFKETLFGKTTKDLQRAVEDKSANTRLDKTIEHFLLILSPYLEKQAALKALEWLIYRFMINDMNKCALLMCILPYYESALFIRILQIIDVNDETSDWYWLRGAQKTGRPISKQTVFTRWGHNQSFRGFMADYIRKMLKVHRCQGNLKIAISFYVTTVVGGLCLLEDVKEEHISYIVKLLPKCLSAHHEMVAGMYFIIAQLALKTNLSLNLIENIINQMIQVNDPPESLKRECVYCLLAITHHQRIEAFSDDILMVLEEKLYILDKIEEFSKTKSVAPFLSAYITGFIRWLSRDTCKLDGSKKSRKFTGLVQRLEATPLSASDASKVIWSLFESIKNNYEALASVKMLNLAACLKGLEASHPEGHSQAMAYLIRLVNNSNAGNKYKEVMDGILTNQSGSTSLAHLIHPDDDIRLAAVKNFVEKVSKGVEKDEMMIKMNMKNMLVDELPAIVLEALTLTKGLRMLEVSYLVDVCQKLLVKSKYEERKWAEVKVASLRVLSQKLANEYDEDLQMTVLFICLPYVLFPKNFLDVAAAKIVLNSNLTERNVLLSALSHEISPYLSNKNTLKTKVYSKKILKILPQVFSTLSKEEHTTLWNYVKRELGSEDCILSHFMCIVLLHYGLGNSKIDGALRLMMAHRLLDACLISFDIFKCSVNETSQILEKLSSSDLQKCVQEVMMGSLPVSFLALCLQEALRVFKIPDICNRSSYWTPFMEGSTYEGNILLLIKAVKGAIQLERFKEIGNTLRNNVITMIFTECLETPERIYYFLAILWGWHPSLSLSDIIDETLQAWSLNLGSALLRSQSTSLAWALGTSQPLVPALISALTNASEMVRSSAIECIKRLAGVIGGRLSQDNHSLMLEAIILQADELIADGSQVSRILAEFEHKPESRSLQVTQALIEVVLSECIPMHLKAAVLYALSNIKCTAVLLNLIPVADNILKQILDMKEDSKLDVTTSLSFYFILLHFTPNTSEILESEDGWQLFFKTITCSKQVVDLQKDVVSPQNILMNQVMSSKFFNSIKNEEVQSQLWSLLISRVVESENPSEAALLRKGLRKVSLDAAVVITQIEKLSLSDKVTSIKTAQAKRIKQKEQVNPSSQLLGWRKLGLMLETIGVMASLTRPWLLVGTLCQCLQCTLTLDTVITDTVQQQILSALLHLLQKSSEKLGDGVREKLQLNIELIVQCIRSSVSPDTHRRAMLILSFAAKISPEAVMHNMMSIFTFMGTSLLRRDDSYTFQVIHQTIQSIVPTLIKCEEKENLMIKLAQVCQVFVDALPDLPEHRRLSLFTQLASTIDASKNLWIIIALMADSHVMRGSVSDTTTSKEEDRRGLPHDIQFALTLSSQFPVVAQVQASCQLMEYISSMPEEIEDLTVHQKLSRKDTKQGLDIVRWDVYSPRQMCNFKYTSTGLIAHLLTSEAFVGQVYESTKGQEEELQELYKQLMEKTLYYLRTVTLSCNQHKDKPGGRLLLSLQRKIVDVIDGINAVLPPSMLIEVTQGLMTSPLPLVRCRAMEILCAKLQPTANFFSEENIESIKPFIKMLLKVAMNTQEQSDNRQTALYTLQLLSRYLAPQVSVNVIQPILSCGVELICREDTEVKLVTQALLVVSEAVIALKAHSVSHLSQLMPVVIRLLAENEVSDHLLLATITTAQKLVENVPQLLSPYLESLICSVCCIYTSKERTVKESRLILRLSTVRDTLIKQIEPRILLPKLTQAFQTLAEKEVPALQTFMITIEMLITHVEENTLKSHKTALLNLFTQALDLRTQKGDSEEICKVEATVSCALSKLLLRLNEHDNTAIFLWLRNWAVDSTNDKPSRLITLYRFADHLAGIFKVLFIKAKLADNLFSHSAALLERNNSLNHQDTVFGSGDDAERKASVLLKAVLDTLTKIFVYDSVNFTNQNRFQLMVKPLIDQLENTVGGDEAYKDRISNYLIPCITKFTVAVGDDSLWKTLNRQILLRVRNDDQPMVILAALQTFQALMETLGEDYLQPLLADTMPYITEVLESLDTEIENTTRDIFTKMQEILGDNLRAYLDY